MLPDLRSVAELAEAWGAALIPLPFVETLLARRTSASFRDCGPASRPATFPLPASGGGLTWPFGGDGVEPAALGTVALPEAGVRFDEARFDRFAPSLPLAHTGEVTRVSAAQTRLAPGRLTRSPSTRPRAQAASMALDASIAHASQREAFGQPVVKFQAIGTGWLTCTATWNWPGRPPTGPASR